jgi:iron complex outermembrane receptor protein
MQDQKGTTRKRQKLFGRVRSAGISGVSLFALSIGLGMAGPVAAQIAAQTAAPSTGTATQDGTGVDEIVVTARARAEKLVDVPISIESFSASKLAADSIDDINALQFEAGFTFNSQGASYSGGGREFPTLIFRGMSSNYGGAFGGSSGALFIDGIYISGGLASVTLSDAASVDVLKGPQNVYFGKNTFGGAINLVTANPSEELHAKASVGSSEMGSFDDVASVEGAIIPGVLSARVSGEWMRQGAQYKAADGGDLGEEDTKGVTLVLFATPTPDGNVWFRTRFHYSRDDDSTAQDGFLDPGVLGSPCKGLANPSFCNGVPTLSTLSPQSVLSGTVMPQALLAAVKSNNFGGGSQQLWLNKVPDIGHSGLLRDNLQASVAGAVEDLPYDTTFQFSAGYNQALADDLEAADHTSTPFFITNTATINRDFEADARLVSSASQPLRAVVGVNHFQSSNQLSQGGDYYGYLSSAFASPLNELDKIDAVYASLEYDILSYLTATAEARYQDDTISDAVSGTDVSKSYHKALPRFILKYHPTTSTDAYVSYSEGVQPAQLQTAYVSALGATATSGHNYLQSALAAQGVGSPYTGDPSVKVYEVGLKQSLSDNKVFFSIDYYHEVWDNALVNTFIFDPTSCPQKVNYAENLSAACPLGSSGQSITGISQNHIQGIEFDGTAKLTPNLTAHLGANVTSAFRSSYWDKSYGAAFTSGSVPNQSGNRVNLVPEYQGTADLTYKDHLFGPYDWFAHGVVNYTGSQFVDATDLLKINAYARVNVSAGITWDNVTFEGYATNLFNNKDWDMAVRFPGSPGTGAPFAESYLGAIVTAPNPLNFGFRMTAKF